MSLMQAMSSPAFDASTLLQTWEDGEHLSLPERSLLLLARAWPQLTQAQWAQVTIGVRDWHLLYLRQELFGARLQALAVCPACGEKLEMEFGTDQVCPAGWELAKLGALWQNPGAAQAEQSEQPVPHGQPPGAWTQLLHRPSLHLQYEAWQLEVCVPCTADLLAALRAADPRQALLAACTRILAAPETTSTLPPALQEQVLAGVQEADPLAEIKTGLCCPACAHEWDMHLDLPSWLWSEISDWVPRLLQQVHILAARYGWSEAAILQLSARRRQMYLDLLAASSQI